ncbi:MAG: hypothetical protein QW728_01900, partial [Thermoplasmata archaeon]
MVWRFVNAQKDRRVVPATSILLLLFISVIFSASPSGIVSLKHNTGRTLSMCWGESQFIIQSFSREVSSGPLVLDDNQIWQLESLRIHTGNITLKGSSKLIINRGNLQMAGENTTLLLQDYASIEITEGGVLNSTVNFTLNASGSSAIKLSGGYLGGINTSGRPALINFTLSGQAGLSAYNSSVYVKRLHSAEGGSIMLENSSLSGMVFTSESWSDSTVINSSLNITDFNITESLLGYSFLRIFNSSLFSQNITLAGSFLFNNSSVNASRFLVVLPDDLETRPLAQLLNTTILSTEFNICSSAYTEEEPVLPIDLPEIAIRNTTIKALLSRFSNVSIIFENLSMIRQPSGSGDFINSENCSIAGLNLSCPSGNISLSNSSVILSNSSIASLKAYTSSVRLSDSVCMNASFYNSSQGSVINCFKDSTSLNNSLNQTRYNPSFHTPVVADETSVCEVGNAVIITVVDNRSMPVENAGITLRRHPYSGVGDYIASGTTDIDGKVRLDAISGVWCGNTLMLTP